MRSGWDQDATYLLFDAGPYGAAHQHEDKLHFVLWSHGRQLLLDPGNFSYDHSRWRRYVLSTAGHNTVLVDGQDQHRAGKKETWFWPRPWNAPLPPNQDVRWVTTPEYDLARGEYAEGYGPKNDIAVTHQRRIVFVKRENVFLISDTLTPRDRAPHRYDALFHLDTTEALVDPATKAVRSVNSGQANLVIMPCSDDGLSVEIVKGRQDEPVQGWASGPWRAIPVAIYHRSGVGTVRFDFVLTPLDKRQRVVGPGVSKTESGVRIAFAQGRSLEVLSSADADAIILKRSGQ
jgi:hypothetical protein